MASRLVMCLALLSLFAVGQAQLNGLRFILQFDNQKDRVSRHQDVIIKYIAEKFCGVPFVNVAYVADSLKDTPASSVFNHESVATYTCKADKNRKAEDLLKRCQNAKDSLITALNPLSPWKQLIDEVKDHTTPDIEPQKILDCLSVMLP